MKLYKFGLSSPQLVKLNLKLPSGSIITLRQTGSTRTYLTNNYEDALFASKQKGVQMMEPTQEEIASYIQRLDPVPTVDKELTKEEALKFVWKDSGEEYVIEELKKRGYICEQVGADPDSVKQAKLKLKFDIVSDKELLAEAARRGLVELPEEPEEIDPDIKGYLDAEDKGKYLSTLHYTKVKQIAEYLKIPWAGNTKEMIKKIIEV